MVLKAPKLIREGETVEDGEEMNYSLFVDGTQGDKLEWEATVPEDVLYDAVVYEGTANCYALDREYDLQKFLEEKVEGRYQIVVGATKSMVVNTDWETKVFSITFSKEISAARFKLAYWKD